MLIRQAPNRGKYMPKNPHRQDRSPGYQLSKQPSSENDIFESKPHGQNKFKPDPRNTFSGKKMVASSTFKPSSGQKQGIRPQTHDSSKVCCPSLFVFDIRCTFYYCGYSIICVSFKVCFNHNLSSLFVLICHDLDMNKRWIKFSKFPIKMSIITEPMRMCYNFGY